MLFFIIFFSHILVEWWNIKISVFLVEKSVVEWWAPSKTATRLQAPPGAERVDQTNISYLYT